MAETTPVIREARVDDEAELWPLASALATSYEPTRERFRAGLRGITEDPRAAVLVAEHDGSLVGYVHVLVHEAFHADGMIGWVEELMVGEDQRGTGCGRALMAAA
ncbi:MAG: GNAT family N-acetyltransferase [Brachybacterium tyrofermentans]